MKVKGWHSQHVEIELPDREVIEGAISLIKRKYSLQNVDGIKDGKMYENVEYATSHSWISKEDRGIPTEEQAKALELINGLQAELR